MEEMAVGLAGAMVGVAKAGADWVGLVAGEAGAHRANRVVGVTAAASVVRAAREEPEEEVGGACFLSNQNPGTNGCRSRS
jgi:hypothetical protein